MLISFVLSVVIGALILFVWSGITNNLPWGIGSIVSVEDDKELGQAIDKQLQQRHQAIFLSDVVAAIVVARPLSYYSIPRYFAFEFLTQVIVASLLTSILMLTQALGLQTQLLLVVLMASMASAAILFQYWNWWGFPTVLAVGSAINLIIGWVVVSFVIEQFII